MRSLPGLICLLRLLCLLRCLSIFCSFACYDCCADFLALLTLLALLSLLAFLMCLGPRILTSFLLAMPAEMVYLCISPTETSEKLEAAGTGTERVAVEAARERLRNPPPRRDPEPRASRGPQRTPPPPRARRVEGQWEIRSKRVPVLPP